MTLLLLAALPFLLKAATIGLALTGYLAQSSYKILQLLVPMVWYHRMGRRGGEMLYPQEETRPSGKLLAAGVLIAVIFSGLAILLAHTLLPLLAIDPAVIRAGMDARFALGPVGAVGVVLFLATLNSYLEEWHFRWWLDLELTRRYGKIIGIAVSALAFGAMHSFIFLGVTGIPVYAIGIAVLGIAAVAVAWSLLLRRAGGFYAAWLSHGLTDILLLGWGLTWLGYL